MLLVGDESTNGDETMTGEADDWIEIDGQRSGDDDARLDAAYQLGFGAFETMTAYRGRILREFRHVERLAGAMSTLGMADVDWSVVSRAVARHWSETAIEQATVRVTVAPGRLRAGFGNIDAAGQSILVVIRPKAPVPPALDVGVVEFPRRSGGTLKARFKALGYADEVVARRIARASGAYCALMLGEADRVASLDFANIFIANGTTIATPPVADGAMPGTVRAHLLEHADRLGLRAIEAPITLPELAAADIAFATNAGIGAVPIARLNGEVLCRRGSVLLERIVDELSAPAAARQDRREPTAAPDADAASAGRAVAGKRDRRDG